MLISWIYYTFLYDILYNIQAKIGYTESADGMLIDLIVMRIVEPASKLRSIGLIKTYFGIKQRRQRYYESALQWLDLKEGMVKQTLQFAKQEYKFDFSLLFYDVTTLYFETFESDDLRKTGFSKEGKHQYPQILLGLLVSIDGYPLAYEIFEGNKFEGYTMLPVIDTFKNKYKLDKLVIIADSGLLSNDNIAALQTKGYDFILGARIKNEKHTIQNKIWNLKLSNGESQIIEKDEHIRLVISFSESRAKKDKSNREKGLKKLEKQIKTGKLTKANINNRGYNKYLKLEGAIEVSIDQEKFKADGKWDGLKGYITNTNLSKNEIIDNYSHLWKIEKAFRVAKTDLRIRPVFHFKPSRIEAHICIAFAAYKVYKELERQLKEKQSNISPEKSYSHCKNNL
jgi:transposase